MIRRLGKWSVAALAVSVILVALLLGGFRLLLPLVPEYHDQIEAWASQAIGAPVTVARVDARWRLGGPELVFYDAQLHAPDGAGVLLSARSGTVGVSVWHLVRTFSLQPGRVILRGVDLDVIRDTGGHWRVLGREFGSPQTSAATKLPRGYLELHDTNVLIEDRLRGGEPLAFSGLRLKYEHVEDFLRLDGSASLPDSLGRSIVFSAQGERLSSPGVASRWQIQVEGEALDLGGLARTFPAPSTTVEGGTANLDLWLTMKSGAPDAASFTLDVSGLQVAHEAGADGAAAVYDRLAGQFRWDRLAAGWRVAGSDIQLVRDGHAWPGARFSVETAESREPGQVVYAEADYLRLEDLAPALPWLPATQWRDRLMAMRPRGEVRDLVLHVASADGKATDYSAELLVERLGTDAAGDVPGFDGISGSLRLDASGGRLEIDAQEAQVEVPAIFAQPLPPVAAKGTVAWNRNQNSWRVLSEGLAVSNADFALQAGFEFQVLPESQSPVIDLRADIAHVDVEAVRSYLPTRYMPPKLGTWLANALVGGRGYDGQVTLIGPLAAFPFDDGEGEFHAQLEFAGAQLHYADGWPDARDLSGTVRFDNAALGGDVRAGEVIESDIAGTQVNVTDLRQAVLEYNGHARGPISSVLTYLQTTPLAERIGPLIHRFRASGDGRLHLDMSLPILDLRSTRVHAVMETDDGGLQLEGLPQQFQRITGRVEYGQNGLTASGVEALLLGRPVEVQIEPEYDVATSELAATRINMRGRFDAVDLGDHLHPALGDILNGSSIYRATARLPRYAPGGQAPVTVTVESDLSGTRVDLPAPLAKRRGDPLPIVVRTEIEAEGRFVMHADYGDATRAALEFMRTGTQWDLPRAEVRFGGGAPALPDHDGVAVRGRIDKADLGGWLSGAGLSRESARGGLTGEFGRSNDIAARIALIDVEVDALDAFGYQFRQVAIAVDKSGREWLVQVESPQVRGVIFAPLRKDDGVPLVAKLEYLQLETGNSAVAASGRAARDPDPRVLPAIQAQIDDFRFDAMQLGRIELEVGKTPQGLEFNRILTQAPSFRIEGSGAWTRDDFGQRSSLTLALNSTNLQDTLERLGFEPTLSGDKAEIKAQLDWPDGPGPDFKKHLSGQITVEVGSGQLRSLQPGAGRVFGLLSIASLPRRLSLDFRDVFDKGFGFDRIAGKFTLDNGDAFTSNLVLEGPAADVGIIGRTGLAARDYDQTAVVYANFGASLPVAGALAAGPAIGAALLIFSQIFKKPLKEMSRAYYRITGSWDEPSVERVLGNEPSAPQAPVVP